MDEIAAAIGMDPVELRRRNFLHEGDTTATEQVMREPVILDSCSIAHFRKATITQSVHGLPMRIEKSSQARNGHCGFLSWLGIHGVGRALSEFAGRRGRND